jgi:hypothetical protein
VNHARHVIREAVIAALKAGIASVGNRVTDNPSEPQRVFPSLAVEDVGEQQATPTLPGGASRLVDRTLVLVVHATVRKNADYARERDQLLAEVEATLAVTAIAGIKYMVPAGAQFDTSTEGDHPTAIARQRFDIFYRTTQGDPSAVL